MGFFFLAFFFLPIHLKCFAFIKLGIIFTCFDHQRAFFKVQGEVSPNPCLHAQPHAAPHIHGPSFFTYPSSFLCIYSLVHIWISISLCPEASVSQPSPCSCRSCTHGFNQLQIKNIRGEKNSKKLIPEQYSMTAIYIVFTLYEVL